MNSDDLNGVKEAINRALNQYIDGGDSLGGGRRGVLFGLAVFSTFVTVYEMGMCKCMGVGGSMLSGVIIWGWLFTPPHLFLPLIFFF